MSNYRNIQLIENGKAYWLSLWPTGEEPEFVDDQADALKIYAADAGELVQRLRSHCPDTTVNSFSADDPTRPNPISFGDNKMPDTLDRLSNMFPYGSIRISYRSSIPSCEQSPDSFCEEMAICVTDTFGDVWYYHVYVDADGIALAPQHCLKDCVSRMVDPAPENARIVRG